MNPAATLVLGAALLLDARAVAPTSGLLALARAAAGILEPGRGHHVRPRVSVYAVREPGGIRLADPDNESWDEMTRLLRTRPRDVTRVEVWMTSGRGGAWAPTSDTRSVRMWFEPMGAPGTADGPLTPDEQAELRRRVALDLLPGSSLIDPRDARALALADVRVVRTLWAGYAHNALALALLAAFLNSLRWLPRAPGWWRRLRAARATARGRCPACGYSTRGLASPTCPECGESLSGPVRS